MRKLLSLVLCGVLVLGITGCGNKKDEEVISYLENKDFVCENKDNIYSCSLTEGVKKHKFEFNNIGSGNASDLVYYYDDGTNNFYIQTNYLTHGANIILKDNSNSEKCLYFTENLTSVKYDEESCSDSDVECINKNSYCRDYLKQVRESVSMFVNIYKSNGMELKIVESK